MPPLINQDGIPISDDFDKATILNNHFASQTRLDTHDLQMPDIPISVPPIPSLSEVQVTEPEVLKILNSLDINKTTGPDKIPNKLFKMCALLLAAPLSKLFNKSLQLGWFPSLWKKTVSLQYSSKRDLAPIQQTIVLLVFFPISQKFSKSSFSQRYILI